MKKPENSFYFLGKYYQTTEMGETVFKIITLLFIISILLYFIIKIYRRRRCPNCNKFMKRDVNDKYEIIYMCKICNRETKTGIFYGSDDS